MDRYACPSFRNGHRMDFGFSLLENQGDILVLSDPSGPLTGSQPPIPTFLPSARACTRQASSQLITRLPQGQWRPSRLFSRKYSRTSNTYTGSGFVEMARWSEANVLSGAKKGLSYSSDPYADCPVQSFGEILRLCHPITDESPEPPFQTICSCYTDAQCGFLQKELISHTDQTQPASSFDA